MRESVWWSRHDWRGESLRSEADAPFDSRGTLAKLRAAATKDAAKQACLHGLDHAAVGGASPRQSQGGLLFADNRPVISRAARAIPLKSRAHPRSDPVSCCNSHAPTSKHQSHHRARLDFYQSTITIGSSTTINALWFDILNIT